MTKYSIRVNNIAYNLLSKGIKKIEGRLYRSIFTKIKPNDIIFFHTRYINGYISLIVKSIKKYNNFREMIIEKGIKNVTPTCKNLDESLAIYRKFYKYRDEIKCGVIAIEFKT